VPNLKKLFDYCPSCGSKDMHFDGVKEFSCSVCSFTYYHNVAAGVGAILELGEKILLIERGKDPGKGKLDFPGGFVEPEESAEEALRAREGITFRPMALWKPCRGVAWSPEAIHLHLAPCSTGVLTGS